jgi:hypothetical protein
MSRGFDVQAQIIAEILEIVFGDDAVLVQIPGQLERANCTGGKNTFSV